MKKSKKASRNRLFKGIFWGVVALGGLWAAFAPVGHHHHGETVHVQVEQPRQGSETVLGEAPVAPPPMKPGDSISAVPPPVKPEDNKPATGEAAVGDEKSQPSAVQVPPMPEPPAIVKGGAPRIALVIDDVGLDMKGSQRAANLPDFVTLSYMPYATRLREQTRDAREKGHELLLHMPMEPLGNADPGPGALLTSLSPDEIRLRFQTALASFVGFDGVNNHMGSKFTADPDDMAIVVDELKQRHLFFLDSRTSPKSVGYVVAREHLLPALTRDVFLDDDQSPQAVREQLEQIEITARRKGYAIAIGHPHAETLQLIEEWLPQAKARGYVFVPLNSLIRIDSGPAH